MKINFAYPQALCVLAAGAVLAGGALSGCDDPPQSQNLPHDGKKVLALPAVQDVQIEMPDQSIRDFGQDFHALATTTLNASGNYIVQIPDPMASPETPYSAAANAAGAASSPAGSPPPYEWYDASWTPAATIGVSVDALSFQTGNGGERSFYGFNERFRTPYNDGTAAETNELPLRDVEFDPNWFDRTFDDRGTAPVDSRSGLDLGDGFSLDAVFAWLTVKYAQYHVELHLTLTIDAPIDGVSEFRLAQVTGDGYFYDVAGAYEMYSAGISFARRDAMGLAVTNALSSSVASIDRAMQPLPLVGKIDHVLSDGSIEIGTGLNAGVRPGVVYELADGSGVSMSVDFSTMSGAVAHVVQGDIAQLEAGQYVRQLVSAPAPIAAVSPTAQVLAQIAAYEKNRDAIIPGLPGGDPTLPTAVDSVAMPWSNLPQSNLGNSVPQDNWGTVLLNMAEGLPLLPYRIWRYYQYDQSYHAAADAAGTPQSWSQAQMPQPWAQQIGLSTAPVMIVQGPVVAVIDSGVDYNHPAIHDALWLNPLPMTDADGNMDRYGWDFVSGDPHPYDDGYHGTEVASLVLAVAPGASIMALKSFSPYGISSSAAVYGAFQYAVDHGAQIILCAWATRKQGVSALEAGIQYAQAHGVVVVAAAGDRGDDLGAMAAFPAAFSPKFANVLTVTGVDPSDQLVTVSGLYANFNSGIVRLAAPGENILVADPRNSTSTQTSTAYSAALATGALARVAALQPSAHPGQAGDTQYLQWIQALLDDAQPVSGLTSSVQGGLRLHVVR